MKTKFQVTIYADKDVELTEEQGIALSDLIEAFYKQVEPSVYDAAID